LSNKAPRFAFLWAWEFNHTIAHSRLKETAMQFINASFVWVVKAVEHQTKTEFGCVIVSTFSNSKFAWFNIALAVANSEKDVLPAAFLQHSFGNGVVLAIDSVLFQSRPVLVPFEMRLYLVFHIAQEGINSQ